MELMTAELEKRFVEVGLQDCVRKDPVIVAKFFDPAGKRTWYATEYDSTFRMFFGYVSFFGIWDGEWGYFSLQELEAYTSPFGTGIERDLYWTERKASTVIR